MNFFEKLSFMREEQSNNKLKNTSNNIVNEDKEYLNIEKQALIVSLDSELRNIRQLGSNDEYHIWQCEMLNEFIKSLEMVVSDDEFTKIKEKIAKYREEKTIRENDFSLKTNVDEDTFSNEEYNLESYKKMILNELNIELKIASILGQNDRNFLIVSQMFGKFAKELKSISTMEELIQFQQYYEDYKNGNTMIESKRSNYK